MPIDKNQLSLRTVCNEDEPFLYHLFSLIKATELGMEHWDPAQREPLLRMQFNAHEQHHQSELAAADDHIVTLNEKAIGRLIVQRTEEVIQLADVTLLPEFRNMGIGAKLIRELQEESRQSNRPIRLNVFKMNRAAKLYTRLGFEIISSTDIQYFMEWKASV